MLKGIITHINSTKYVVVCDDKEFNCTLRGIFRNKKITPFVGDKVEIDENKKTIEKINERRNELLRPSVANIDIALVLTSTKEPDLDLLLLDKLLSQIIINDITPVICFTKLDLLEKNQLKQIENLIKYYNQIGIKAITNEEVDTFIKLAKNKIIVCCGQTGAGKSSFINKIDSNLKLSTNPISKALNRGIHTTRYVSLYKIKDFYIADSPGFSALDLSKYLDEKIAKSFVEFNSFNCKYKDCNHINTDGCEVENNTSILKSRYQNYTKIIKENHENSRKLFSK